MALLCLSNKRTASSPEAASSTRYPRAARNLAGHRTHCLFAFHPKNVLRTAARGRVPPSP